MLYVVAVARNLTRFAVSANVDKLAVDVRDTREAVEEVRLNQHEQEIQDWLSAPDPSGNYENALEKRHKGTGLWFTGGQPFAGWRKQSKAFLWLHGIPGSGKTVLSSTIIEHLTSINTSDQCLIYFYFAFNDTNKQTLQSMLRSLINQLYQGQPGTRGPLDELWNSCRSGYQHLSKTSLGGSGYQHLSKTTLGDVLLAMLSKVKDITIVLDALDESTTRSDLLAWLRDVVTADCFSGRVLVTARREEEIESALRRWILHGESISIQQDDVKEDIRAYINHKIRNDGKLDRWRKMPKVQGEIEAELVLKADGM